MPVITEVSKLGFLRSRPRVHEALVTLDPEGDPGLLYRRPVERYDLFAGLSA